MRRIYFFLLLLYAIVTSPLGYGQNHVLPENGSDGIMWKYNNSFIISWESVTTAVAYEYVISDNPLCFRGCSGDTRNGIVKDTFAISFSMQKNKWYYWVTRVITENDTSYWSDISSFRSKIPENSQSLFKLSPNPIAVGRPWNLSVDWLVNPSAKTINIVLYDLKGLIRFQGTYNKSAGGVRFDEFQIDVGPLQSGLYIGIYKVDDNPNVDSNRIREKLIVLE